MARSQTANEVAVLVVPEIGRVIGATGKHLPIDMSLPGVPLVFIDADREPGPVDLEE
jgi:hypothetical protein